MRSGNFKVAYKTIRESKWQSSLTMFGIVVGIVSVVTIVSLGQGIKRQIVGEIKSVGSDLITVRAGKGVKRDADGNIQKISPDFVYGFGSGTLNDRDVAIVEGSLGVKDATPIRLLNGSVIADGREYSDGFVLGTNPSLPNLINQKLEYGSYFTTGETSRQVAVIGKSVAEELFQENVPLGQIVTIRGQDFIVRGVFEKFSSNPLGQGIDLNQAIFVPTISLKEVAGTAAPVVRVLARPQNPKNAGDLAKQITASIKDSHGGQDDTTVLLQSENLQVTSSVLDKLTGFIAAIAAISLVVGGIGIMNIMLVSVSERTREIGVRKAVGATNRQIRNQFMAEAIVLSVLGGIVGIIASFVLNFLIRVTTDLTPVITWPVVLVAAVVSVSVGIISGTIPAVKAARKDPIDALRIGN